MNVAAWRNALIVLVLAAVCILPALGRLTLTEHEVFAAEPAREMLGGGAVAYQQFGGQPRLKKPPGQSWLIAASIKALGPTDFAARLPSAIAGAGAAALAALIGTWTLGRRIGLIAGLMMLTCVGVQQRAHLAEADMALTCAVAIANAAVILPLTRGGTPARGWGLAFWAAVAGGFMLKGPIVFGFTVLPAAVAWALLKWKLRDPAAQSLSRGPLWWPWILLGLTAIGAWVVAALHALPFSAAEAWSMWKHEIADRVSGDIRRDPLVAYVWLIPQATLPWIVFAIAAIGPYRRLRLWQRPAETFLNCWALCGALVISAIAFKRMHYALPMLLPVILQAAYGFDRILGWWIDRRPVVRQPAAQWGAMSAWFGAAIAGWAIFWFFFSPRQDPGAPVKAFAAAVNAAVPAGETIYLLGVGEDRVAWYLRRPIQSVTLAEMAQRSGYAIVEKNLSDLLLCERTGEMLAEAESYNPPGRQDEDDREGERRLLIHVPPPQPLDGAETPNKALSTPANTTQPSAAAGVR